LRSLPGSRFLGSRLTVLLCLSICVSAPVFAQLPDQCSESSSNPADVSLQLSLKQGQTVFRQGEIIELELAFTGSSKYQLSTRNYDRSGRLHPESLCLEPSDKVEDPLTDYFSQGIFSMGGLSGIHRLDDTPYNVSMQLNEWKSVPPGRYRLRVVSRRVSYKHPIEARAENLPVASNSVEFDVIKADPDWQARQLQTALSLLGNEKPSDDAQHAARVLRFLGSENATRELVRRYWSDSDQPYGWNLKFGLVGSPHRQLVLDGMRSAISDPQHPITPEFLRLLTLLEIQQSPENHMPAYDAKNREEWEKLSKARSERYDKKLETHLSELAEVIGTKVGRARSVSAKTLLELSQNLNNSARTQLRQLLVASWDSLPGRTQNELIQFRWEEVGGPELLPILRRIVNSAPKLNGGGEQPERSPALRHLYELSPTEGRDLILREISNRRGDIYIDVLGLLPDRELPQVDAIVRALPEQESHDRVLYELIDRYASSHVLPEVKARYQRAAGTWACAEQISMLRYFLRTDPEYGRRQIATALTLRKDTGCYQMIFSGLTELVKLPSVERLAITALDDSSAGVVRDAAQALARYGSTRAEAALWRRMEKFHEEWKDKPEQLQMRGTLTNDQLMLAGLEGTLINSLVLAHGWLCGPDKLNDLARLVVTPQGQEQVSAHKAQWEQEKFALHMSWWPEGVLDYDVAGISGKGMDSLKEKLAQYRSGTRFSMIMTNSIYERHREEIAEVERFASTSGLLLEITRPR
jgi:hypothetical protein